MMVKANSFVTTAWSVVVVLSAILIQMVGVMVVMFASVSTILVDPLCQVCTKLTF